MAEYVAMSRIERAAPRFRPAHATTAEPAEAAGTTGPHLPTELSELSDRAQIQDLAGAGFAADLVDLLADIRQVWRQGLEVLADPQGWRS